MNIFAPQQPQDEHFMGRALALTRRGLGASSPNPAVGAVVVRDGAIVGKGWHMKKGLPHAEPLALVDAGEAAKGATIYVTLEPCNHHGSTPPCSKAILAAGVSRVVYGASDSNPKAKGGGEFLAQSGLNVTPGVLAAKCEHEHRFFLTYVTKGRPHVILKTAATLDGKTATRTGDSRWITGPNARRYVHRLRHWCDSICVGVGTAIADDPQLTCRLPGGRDPLRVVVDRHLRLRRSAKVFDRGSGGGCLVACGPGAPEDDVQALRDMGVEVARLAENSAGGVDADALLRYLGDKGVTSMLLEGGSTLGWTFMENGLVDEVMYFFAPKICGGVESAPMLGGAGVELMAQAIELDGLTMRRYNPDVLLWGRVKSGS